MVEITNGDVLRAITVANRHGVVQLANGARIAPLAKGIPSTLEDMDNPPETCSGRPALYLYRTATAALSLTPMELVQVAATRRTR